MKKSIRFQLNGKPTTLETNEDRTLLWVLRTDLGLTGAKFGCGIGVCGSCTVVVDGKTQRSCQTLLKEVAGTEVTTIEGLAQGGELHPLQQAFQVTLDGLDDAGKRILHGIARGKAAGQIRNGDAIV